MQSTGKRAKVLIIDDLLKGESEAYNIDLHRQLVNRFDSDWTSRSDDDNQKIFLMGTMWAPTDLLNVIYERAQIGGELRAQKKYVELSKNKKQVFIAIPALDETDESTCPKRFSTAKLKAKRATMDRYLWQCEYQQDPIAPEGYEFSWDNLKTYTELPKTVSHKGSLDPARRGKNYVSMPIFYETEDGKHYLVDFLYEKKGMQDLYMPIARMIKKHRLTQLVLENNTDTSLKMILEERLARIGYRGCTIIEKYSTVNKEKRIKDYQAPVKNQCYFPDKSILQKGSPLAKAMDSITIYSFEYPTKYDDAIDSVVLYCQEFVDTEFGVFAEAGSFSRRW